MPRRARCAARSRTTSSRSTSPRRSTSSRREPSMRLVDRHDRVLRAARCRSWNTISISGYHIREAGSTAVQELAFTLADGIAYVRGGASSAGCDVDEFAPRLSFFFNAHNDFFEEIAKFRAARRIWARVMRERFGAKNRAVAGAALPHADRAAARCTAQQPENNVVRTAIQALAAVLGGTQSLHTNSLRRGARAADRGRGPDRAAHPADHRARDRRREHGRPARRLATTSSADRRARSGRRYELLRPDRRARRRRRRDRGRASSSARSRTPRSATSARSRRGERVDRRRQPLPAGGRRAAAAADRPCARGASRSSACRRLRGRRDAAAVEAALALLAADAARESRNLMPAIVAAATRLRDDGRDV